MKKAENLSFSDFPVTDREECGVIVGVKRGKIRVATEIVKVKNVADDPENHYAILASDLEQVEKSLPQGKLVIGFFHTHTDKHDAAPSEEDMRGAAIFPNFLNLVYKPSTGEKVWYRHFPLEVEPGM